MTTRFGFEKAAALAALLVLLRLPAGAQNAGGVDGDNPPVCEGVCYEEELI